MAKNKTTETEHSVSDFINGIADEKKRTDSFQLVELLTELTGFAAIMWGPSIIGFGKCHYKYKSGHEGDTMLAGFSPRKTAFVLYLMPNFPGRGELLEKLGKHTTGVGCIYFKRLADIDIEVFKEMVKVAIRHMSDAYSS